MTFRASIEWDDLTWGELRAFARVGDHMADGEPVAQLLSSYNEEPIGFQVDMSTGGDA